MYVCMVYVCVYACLHLYVKLYLYVQTHTENRDLVFKSLPNFTVVLDLFLFSFLIMYTCTSVWVCVSECRFPWKWNHISFEFPDMGPGSRMWGLWKSSTR